MSGLISSITGQIQKKLPDVVTMGADKTGATECHSIFETAISSGKLTIIPAGTYKMRLSKSARFGRVLPEIMNVPNFTGIRIHGGTTAEDSHGCLLVGINEVKGKVLKSQITLAKLLMVLTNSGESEFTIIINRL